MNCMRRVLQQTERGSFFLWPYLLRSYSFDVKRTKYGQEYWCSDTDRGNSSTSRNTCLPLNRSTTQLTQTEELKMGWISRWTV